MTRPEQHHTPEENLRERTSLSRRAFLVATGSLLAPLTAAAAASPRSPKVGGRTSMRPLIVSTWSFGKPANEAALAKATAGGSNLDAVEAGIHVPESDRSNSSVGLGGTPNAVGVVQLDACIMDGPGHRAGSVAALEGIAHPISVARRIMETTRHVMLVGEGARQFALDQGFERSELVSERQRQAWEQWKAKQPTKPKPGTHDTIALLVLGEDGHLAGGCSTSGMGYKLAGRVGDSPILGSGLYVDDEVGAAGATGIGENVMRYCASFQIVEAMRRGASPTDACLEVIRRIARADPRGLKLDINFVALDRKGRYGAAGTSQGFDYSVTFRGYSAVLKPVLVTA